MSELTKVPGPSSPLRGIGGKVVTVVVIAIALAIVKPWGTGEPITAGLPDVPEPSPTPASSESNTVDLGYDNAVFGVYEPKPEWALWPAGYFTTFGFAMRIDERSPPLPGADVDPARDASGASPDPDVGPGASIAASTPRATSTPLATATPREGEMVPPPSWTDVIPFNAESHLTLMAINMPLGFRIPETRLTRVGADASATVEPLVVLDSPWPSHFLVLGIDDGTGRGAVTAWPIGRYRLDLTIEPGGYRRTIQVDVGDPDRVITPTADPAGSPKANPTDSPAGSAPD
jgi:hypothetical protein